MNYADIRKYDISNTPGVATTLFVSGCKFKCNGCFNLKAQDFIYGEKFNQETEDRFILHAKDEKVVNIALLGGEVFQQDLNTILHLVIRLKKEAHKPIWIWTGYLYEDIKHLEILNYIDILVDGQFVLEKKDLNLKYRGSSNQRVIDIQESLKQGQVVLSKYN